MCLHERGREFARYHMHPDRQPILPDFAPEEDAGDAAEGEKPEAEMQEGDKPEAEMKDGDKPEEEAEAAEKPEKAEAEEAEKK